VGEREVRVFKVRFDEASLIDWEAFVEVEVGRLPDDLGVDDRGPTLDLRQVAEHLDQIASLIGAGGDLALEG
jgi:hypothetical protein